VAEWLGRRVVSLALFSAALVLESTALAAAGEMSHLPRSHRSRVFACSSPFSGFEGLDWHASDEGPPKGGHYDCLPTVFKTRSGGPRNSLATTHPAQSSGVLCKGPCATD